MADNATENTRETEEDRLKGILYRFMDLQDRLQAERLAVANQSAKIDELIKTFTTQVMVLKTLAPNLQRQILETVAEGSHACAKRVGEVVAKAATEHVEKSSQELQESVNLATRELRAFEKGTEKSFYYYVAGILAMVVLVGFLVGKFAVPTPYFPLIGEDLKTYRHGRVFDAFWPKLSENTQKRLLDIANGKKNADGEDESFLQVESQ